jgi:hypothetical protein
LGYEYMWKIASLCRDNNIAMMVFEMPCSKEAQNNCADTSVQKNINNTGYRLLIHNLNNFRFCDTLFDPQKDWLSKNHLNYYGSIKLTTALQRLLIK